MNLMLMFFFFFVFFFLNRPSFAHALHVILNRGVWSTWQIQIYRSMRAETLKFAKERYFNGYSDTRRVGPGKFQSHYIVYLGIGR